MTMNERRRAHGRKALRDFGKGDGFKSLKDFRLNEPDILTDLLADLMHYAASRDNLDFDKALDTARGHFAAETGA